MNKLMTGMSGTRKERNIEQINVYEKYSIELGIGEFVYLKTDNDQTERIVTGISISSNGIIYSLSCSTYTTDHYSIEISKDRDTVKVTTN